MLPDYELTTRLGGDEAFELHRGRRTRTAASVLVKLPRAQSVRAAESAAALRRECALAAGLASAATLLPRLVELPERCILVMEDPGGVLLSALTAAGRPPLDVVLAVGVQLADALAELHRRGIVHHAIRPDAVLCDAPGASAWLVDWAHARAASADVAMPGAVLQSTGRLTYASPEQTGRMDCAVDHRSDLYSLGVVLYELLCGAPPFVSDDPLELTHRHIAAAPVAPAAWDAAIPAPLSDVVMRLLAKAPGERYQTAAGLADDLRRCAREWEQRHCIEPFALGQRDASGQLAISPKLYGREREVEQLLAAFERACIAGSGPAELFLVEGYAGIGKTALIQQLYRPIVRQRGYFISGKFDQVMRGVPFGALIDAFRALVQQLLTESETQLAAWRSALARSLGNNGGVLIEVIPEIEFIVGPQPAPAVLGSTEAQNRFQRVLQSFVAALAQAEHPLVLFLDDLQWADAATLGLLEPLLAGGEPRCLLLLGAYRENEPDAAPGLAPTLTALQASGVVRHRIALGPLPSGDLTALVADTLHWSAEAAEPLAKLIGQKTGGNPFFVTQFLRSLEREGHLRFDAVGARWICRTDEVAGAPLADNVIELMTRSIQRLPSKSQYALTLAACIGNRFDRRTLAIVSEQTSTQIAADLTPALEEGLLVAAAPRGQPGAAMEPDDDTVHAFLHDRVQQAAYALIPVDRRRMVHLTVGRLLRSRTPPDRLDAAHRFDILQHLNLGRALISNRVERMELAQLNLEAGQRAKASTAHDSALDLLCSGIDLLDDAAWVDHYALCFELHLEAAESRYLCGQFEAALDDFRKLLERAATPIDRARAIRLRSVQYENMARYAESIATAREGLCLFGVTFADDEAGKLRALDTEIEAIESLRAGRAIASLVDLPVMRDPQVRIVMSMLTDIWSAAYIVGDPTLARLISATLVRLSLQHGNAEESAYGYVTHAITVGPVRGSYAHAYEYGCLALAVNERFDDSGRRAKIYQQFHAHVNFWCRPFATCVAYAREACRSGLDSGDFLYAAYGAGTELWSAMIATQDLAQFARDYEPSIALIEKLNNRGFADSVRVLVNWSRAIQGLTDGPLSLSDSTFDEAAYLQAYRDSPFFTTIHAIARLQLCSLLGERSDALAAARRARAFVHHLPGTVWPIVFDFWGALALAAGHVDMAGAERDEALAEVKRAQARFEVLSTFCAENFLCQALLLAAEVARIERREGDAVELCGRAIEYAATRPLIVYSGLANELCGRCLIDSGRTALARMYLAQARACYARWGARAKVDAMLDQYSMLSPRGQTMAIALRSSAPSNDESSATSDLGGGRADGFDFFSVSKAAQAIAAEVELDGLLARLMRIVIESAGAESGALVLETDAGPVVHAVEAIDKPPSVIPMPLDNSDTVPISIVNYVRRTTSTVVIAQALTDGLHATDPYILRHRPRSVMCMPVQKQGRLVGVLYLENRRVEGVFTADRAQVLRILSTQAAISLENARLFAGQRREIAEREQAQAQLAAALADVQRLRADLEAENSYLRRDLIANVSHDLRTPLVSIRGYLEVLSTRGEALDAMQRRNYLDTAVRQSEHLGTLIDELFELAKLDFKGVTLQREPFHLGELASDVRQKFQLIAEGRRVALELMVDAALPLVHADIGLMERVFDNLIGNALKYTPEGGQVEVSLTARDQLVWVRVSDSGVGIASTDLPFIFDRFYRAAGERSRTGGAGLGLAITKRILDLHDARIEVLNQDRGICFRFCLPVHTTPA